MELGKHDFDFVDCISKVAVPTARAAAKSAKCSHSIFLSFHLELLEHSARGAIDTWPLRSTKALAPSSR
jgi:hypothetical protein